MSALLEVRDLEKRFGGVTAVTDVSFHVDRQEIVALIGPNGAGKTTLFNMISGVLIPTKGEIRLEGRSIIGRRPYELARLGLTRTFQNLQVFYRMTVLENVLVGYNVRMKSNMIAAGLALPTVRREENEARERALYWLGRFGLEKVAHVPAGTLSYGQLRLLEIARSAVAQPQLMLLDEPMAGLNPKETQNLVEMMKTMREEGMTFLFVEHDMQAVMHASDRIVVLDYGRMIAVGEPDEIAIHPEVIQAYLGQAYGQGQK